jgi:hypothetical protein
MILLFITLWFLSGVLGFHYWWTTEEDFTASDIIPAIIIGAGMGPFSWIAGYYIHKF